MDSLIFFALDALFGGLVLWIASKITAVDLGLRETVLAVGAAALVSLIPAVGWVLSIIVLFYLLKKFSRADIWPDVILLVIVSRLVSFAALAAMGGLN